MFKSARFFAFLAFGFIAASAWAQDAETIRKKLQEKLPHLSIGSVSKTTYADLYEVVVNSTQVVYTDAKASMVIRGSIYDIDTKLNVSEKRLEELRRVDFSSLPLDKAIVKKKGDGSRKIAVFSDPDCPFCQRLEPQLAQLDNVTIYTFLYPLQQLHPDAMRKATMVWCAPDRQAAWDNLMLHGKTPENGNLSCANPLLEIVQLAQKLGITGTPGIVFSDGKMTPGFMTAEQIEAQLSVNPS